MEYMTNRELLAACIKRSGLKKTYIAEAINKKPRTLSKKLAGSQDFTETEMQILARILQLSTEERVAIFFAEGVAKTATT